MLWGAGVAMSLWLSALALQGPTEQDHHEEPPALIRHPTNAEKKVVDNRLSQLQLQLKAAKERNGAWPQIHELEGTDSTGQPWLPDGLPDNPLVPGVSNVADGCDVQSSTQADWLYCAQNGHIQAGGITPP